MTSTSTLVEVCVCVCVCVGGGGGGGGGYEGSYHEVPSSSDYPNVRGWSLARQHRSESA